jgi:hypothetical protein
MSGTNNFRDINQYNSENTLINNNFSIEDIELFINSYEKNLLEGISPNSKLALWVEFLKTKRYYQINQMDEDYFFHKRFNITNDDLMEINKLINRLKKGKQLLKTQDNKVLGSNFGNSDSTFVNFDKFNENDNYDDGKKFELLSQVEDAMNDYYTKMKKVKNDKYDKMNVLNRQRDMYNTQNKTNGIINSIDNIANKYYSDDALNSQRPNIEYDALGFANSPLISTNKTAIISKLDKINNLLDCDANVSCDFDTQFKKHIPNINTKKKTYQNIVSDSLKNELNDEISSNEFKKPNNDPASLRFWQDQGLLKTNLTTRNTCKKNDEPFENQFQYLDCNFNRVMDPRLLGESSRLENRSYQR